MPEENKALTLVKWISDKAIDGVRPLSSARDLADEYLLDEGYRSNSKRVDALINWETTKNFTSGFVTGLGGVLVLPFSLPAAFAASWLIQARMAAAIARIYGHNIHSDRVRTFIVAALVGDSLKDIAKASGIAIGRGLTKSLIERVPGRALIEINKRVGFRLLTKAGEKGGLNLMRGVPFAGGFVGGLFDAAACRVVGHNARKFFNRSGRRGREGPLNTQRRGTRKSIARASRPKRSKRTAAESKSPLVEWTQQLESLRTLSLRQPWAWLVVNGYKDIENRSWRTNHRGPLLIHASSTTTTLQADLRRVKDEYGVDVPENLEFGGVGGIVDVVDCVKESGSRWHFRGSWGWVMANPRRLPFRKCKGAVGFFKLKSH